MLKITVIGFCLIIVMFLFNCASIIFNPETIHDDKTIEDTKEYFLKSRSGNKIHILSLPAANEEAVLLYLHGNSKNSYKRLSDYKWVSEHGVSLYLLDYSGFGKATGKATMKNTVLDVKSAIEFIRDSLKVDSLSVLGTSLGGALLLSALESQDVYGHINHVIVDCSFDRLENVINYYLKESIFGWPFIWVPGLMLDEDLEPVNNFDNVRGYKLVVSGCKTDSVIPFKFTKALIDSLKPEILYEFELCGHSKTFRLPENREKLLDILIKR